MSLGRRSFLAEYETLCSEQQIENANNWLAQLCGSRAKKLFIKKGRRYLRSEFKIHKKFGSEAYDLIIVLDILTRSTSILATAALERLVDGDIREKDKDAHRATVALLSYLSQTLTSFERAILYESDLSARIIARSICECSDYMLAMMYDDELIAQYIASQENFKDLWGKHFRTKNINKLRKRAIKKLLGDEGVAQDMAAFLKEEYEIVSRAGHPSYVAGFMMFFNQTETDASDPLWGFLASWPHVAGSFALFYRLRAYHFFQYVSLLYLEKERKDFALICKPIAFSELMRRRSGQCFTPLFGLLQRHHLTQSITKSQSRSSVPPEQAHADKWPHPSNIMQMSCEPMLSFNQFVPVPQMPNP